MSKPIASGGPGPHRRAAGQGLGLALALTVSLAFGSGGAWAAEPVTLDTYIRAETDRNFMNIVKEAGLGAFNHARVPTQIDQQTIIRMNRDTLYSFAIFDLATPVTITKPEARGRFQSMMVINQDHYIKQVEYAPGTYTLTRDKIGTRYVGVAFRTFVDPNDPQDLAAARAAQDGIRVQQAAPGKFELPDWDWDSHARLHERILALTPFITDLSDGFGDAGKVKDIPRLIGTAGGWGANRVRDAKYINVTPPGNDGKMPHVLTVGTVPVDGFWSVSLYNEKGFFEKNPQEAYSVNNVTAKKEADGSVRIHFGGDPGQPNYLAIMPGWNYIVRLYQPRAEVIDGRWNFPNPVPVR